MDDAKAVWKTASLRARQPLGHARVHHSLECCWAKNATSKERVSPRGEVGSGRPNARKSPARKNVLEECRGVLRFAVLVDIQPVLHSGVRGGRLGAAWERMAQPEGMKDPSVQLGAPWPAGRCLDDKGGEDVVPVSVDVALARAALRRRNAFQEVGGTQRVAPIFVAREG